MVARAKKYKPTKYYSVVKSAKFFKGRKYKPREPFLVLRHNTKNHTCNPAKQVKTRTSGSKYIKSKKGLNMKIKYWN